jgi:hypothetical protein
VTGAAERRPREGDVINECRVYWGSHGCDLERGHDGACECACCDCWPEHTDEPDEDDVVCVAKPPYYGPETRFYGEDVDARGLTPLT